jgi:hypothetical protein
MEASLQFTIRAIDALNAKIRWWEKNLHSSPGSKKYCRSVLAETRQLRDLFFESLIKPQL